MKDYTGTTWERSSGTTQGTLIVIVADPQATSGLSNRPLRAKRENGGHFWVTPEGLSRKYHQTENLSIPNTKTRDQRLTS